MVLHITHTYILGSYRIYHTNCVCKLCICKHSDKHMPDPNRNLEKSNPRKYIVSLPTPLSRTLSFLRSRDHASNLVVFAMCFQVPDLFVVKYGVYRAYFVYFKPRGHTVR